MGNQCCQGNSPVEEGKNSITMGNPKDGVGYMDSAKTSSNEKEPTKIKEDESIAQLKYGKTIKSHNSKQDYQQEQDGLIGSQQINPAFDEPYSNQDQNKTAPQKAGTRDIAEKSVAHAGSGVMVKGSSLKPGSVIDQADILTKDNAQQSVHAGSSSNGQAGVENRSKKSSIGGGGAADKATGGSAGNSTNAGSAGRPVQQAGSSATGGGASQSTSVPLPQPPLLGQQQRGSSGASGLPPSSAGSVAKQKKQDVSPQAATSGNSTTDNAKKGSQEIVDKSAGKKVSNQKSDDKVGTKKSEYTFSAESLIHLKKGTFSNQYKVGEILGEGAFGQVSKVIHKSTGMVRAMKTIKKSGIIKEEEDRLFSEMNILKNLDHPNILRLIELFQDSKNYYLITEYCSGGELFDKIKSMTNFTEKIAADYMKQILSAVVYCHQNNIVHRDLKPENLLFDSEKKNANLKVIDFGTSRKLDKNKKMSKRLGTPYYIAPEVLEQNYDEKCDVWSCGVILYILLCGYPPFGGRSEDEILKKVRAGKFRFEAEDWDRISDEAKALINKMLTYDPKKRPSAEAAMSDPWIQKNASSNHISTRALTNLSSFQTRSKLKQAILTFIVSQVVSQQDKEELLKTFKQLDRNSDGTLSKEELIEGYTSVLGNKESALLQVDKIFDEVDLNRSGKVDFTEFMMAASNKENLLSKAKIEQSFKIFDSDGNGFITQEELSYIMGDIPDDFWKEILDECDTNKDGMISQAEFIELLLKKKIPM